MSKQINDKQEIQLREIHLEIYRYIKGQQYSPSYREIAENCNVSLSHGHQLVAELRDMGYIEKVNGKCRTIRVVR